MFFLTILLMFFIFYLFPEIKIFSYSIANFLPFIGFSFLFIQKDFRETVIKNKKILIIWLVFVLINLVSLIFSPYKYLAFLGTVKVISFSLLFWILLWFLKENYNWQIFLKFLIGLLVFSVLINLFLFFNPNLIYNYFSNLYFHRITYPRLGYPFAHPNAFGSFSIIILILILFGNFFLKYRPILYLFISLAIILTGSKASFLFYIFFSLISFFIYKSLKENIPIILTMIITSLVFINLWLPLKENIILSKVLPLFAKETKYEFAKKIYTLQSYEKTSVKNRLEIWENSVRYILQRPLTGYGALVHRYELIKESAHNIYLDFLISYGLVGFLFLIYLITQLASKVLVIKKPLYTFFFLYFFLNSLIETMFFSGFTEIIFFSFLIKLKNEEIFNNNNYA